jgi:hypothetical protein
MNYKIAVSAAALLSAFLSPAAYAGTFQFGLDGSGVTGDITLTYGTATDATYPQAYEVTGISGTFSDSNIGISNATITGPVSLSPAKPESGNTLTPADFSKLAVTGLPAQSNGAISFDNLFYPKGSPQTATDYPFSGGFLDIYGLLFNLGNGDVVNVFSNGIVPPSSSPDYGAVVASPAMALDYVAGGVTAATPEPDTFALLATGLLAAPFWRRLSQLVRP